MRMCVLADKRKNCVSRTLPTAIWQFDFSKGWTFFQQKCSWSPEATNDAISGYFLESSSYAPKTGLKDLQISPVCSKMPIPPPLTLFLFFSFVKFGRIESNREAISIN